MLITIRLNGEQRSFEQDMNISCLLRILKVPPKSVVVELNREILLKNMFDHVKLQDGDKLELIRLVEGG
jgi:sulfur carrier protein